MFNLIGAFASMIWAWVGSSYGFDTVFVVGLVMLVVVLVTGLAALSIGARRLRALWE